MSKFLLDQTYLAPATKCLLRCEEKVSVEDEVNREQRLKNLQTFKEQIQKAKTSIKTIDSAQSPAKLSLLNEEEPPSTPLSVPMSKFTSPKVPV